MEKAPSAVTSWPMGGMWGLRLGSLTEGESSASSSQDVSPSEPAVSWGWGSGKGEGDWSTKGQTKLWFVLQQCEGIPLHGSGQVSPAFFPSAFSTTSVLEWCLHLSLLTKEMQLWLYISFLGEISEFPKQRNLLLGYISMNSALFSLVTPGFVS